MRRRYRPPVSSSKARTRMDHALLHALNAVLVAHPLLADAALLLGTWVVPLVVAAAVIPWLVGGPGVDARRLATAAGLAAAALAMAGNQVISHLWERPRPSVADPTIVAFAGVSPDPSFPSDHVAAAFAIAFGALLYHRRSGRVLLALAVLVAASRLLVGAHYPTDVLGGVAVAGAAALAVRAAESALRPIVALVARPSDHVLAAARRVRPVAALLDDERLRVRLVLLVGAAIGLRLAVAMHAHLLDEMPLALLAVWGLAVAAIARAVQGEAPRGRAAVQAVPTR